ncbi:MAG: LPS export ABC transporter periplasmic protein LptC [Candidatus Eisenbacteria bacterium]|nr:LPS export ABC transporter periplasmic protein LptC [Candidatus Eisenbacteria bacterium]
MTAQSTTDLGRMIRCHAGRFLMESLARCPRPIGLRIGRRLGSLGFRLVRRDRWIARDNLAHAWPELSEVEQGVLARAVFERLGENIFDVAALPRWSPEERRRRLDVAGLDHLTAALAAGHGVILIGGHQGAWELIAPALSDRGVSVIGLARPIREARLDQWLDAHRAAIGTQTIKVGGLAAARRAHRILADGGVLGLLIDHRVRNGGRWFDFFGRPSRFATGPARLAIATGATLVPVTIGRREDGGHRITIGPAILPVGAGPLSVDRLLGEAVAALEQMIRRDPASWAWMHPRWGRPVRLCGAKTSSAAVQPGLSLPALLTLSSLLAGAALFATGCSESKPPGGAPANEESSSMLAGVTLRETFDGQLRWVLKADSSETFRQPDQTIATRVHVDFYNSTGQITSVLTADEGVVQRSNNDMTARGHVLVVTAQGDTLTTERLDWSSVQNRVKTDLPFRLARPDGVMTGVGFESNPDLTDYTTQQVRIDARDRPHD